MTHVRQPMDYCGDRQDENANHEEEAQLSSTFLLVVLGCVRVVDSRQVMWLDCRCLSVGVFEQSHTLEVDGR